MGDVIDRINAANIGVEARINDTGDGVLLVDTAGGLGKIKVADSTGTVATDLNLAGESVEVDIDGTPTQIIDGTTVHSLDIAEGDTLSDVVTKINNLKAGVAASFLNDGQGVRLSLTVNKTGAANEVLLESERGKFSISGNELSSRRALAIRIGAAIGGRNFGHVVDQQLQRSCERRESYNSQVEHVPGECDRFVE